jgi:hypothetical protein
MKHLWLRRHRHAIAATIVSRTLDWNFLLLRSSVALSWLLVLSAALTLSRRFSNGGAVGAFTAVAVFLGSHVALESSVAPVQAATLRNASGKWIVQILASEVRPKGASELVRLLHANTNIPRDTQVSAVDVDLAPLTGSPQVTAIREMAIDGACGPWSTPGTSAASSSSACSGVGSSPRSMSQIISGKRTWPISCSIG